MNTVCKEQKIALTEKQKWFIKCAIDAACAILPLSERQLDAKIFKNDYGYTQQEMREEINDLRLKLKKL